MPSDLPTSRGTAIVAFLICLCILGAAAWMSPDPRGHGTHEQLGLPACGMVATWGLPCPTCGMCTSFSLAIRGRFLAALGAQPAGLALFAATVFVAYLSASVVLTRRMPRVPPLAWSMGRWALAFGTTLAAGWIYKLLTWSRV